MLKKTIQNEKSGLLVGDQPEHGTRINDGNCDDIGMIEVNLCVKCKKNGNLLVCSSEFCWIMIHKSCLASDPCYDSNGNFYCPFCDYSLTMSSYNDIKRKASMAIKGLQAFVCLETQNKSNDLSDRVYSVEQNNQEQDVGLPESSSSKRDCPDKEINPQQRKELENEGAELHLHHNLSSMGRATNSINENSESELVGASEYFEKAQNKKVQHTSEQAVPRLRRTKLTWAKEEEEKLQEGIRLFTGPGDTVMPWSTILRFGSGVFDKRRTAIDLKDKWRNMCKNAMKD